MTDLTPSTKTSQDNPMGDTAHQFRGQSTSGGLKRTIKWRQGDYRAC